MCNTGVGAEATVHNDRWRTFEENDISGGKGVKVETRNKKSHIHMLKVACFQGAAASAL